MGISAKDVVEKRRTVEIDAGPLGFPGDVVKLTYRPYYFDAEAEAVQTKHFSTGQTNDTLYEMFCTAVISWDVTQIDGTPFPEPLTPEAIKSNRIAGRFVLYLWMEMLKYYRAGEPGAVGGSTGSPPTEDSESRPTTTSGTE